MRAGELERACAAFAESLRLESNPGALYSLADCEDQRGRLATATAHYAEYVRWVAAMPPTSAARHESFRDLAARRLDALRPQVPTVRFHLADAPPRELKLDDLRLTASLRDLALPVDPGAHTWILTTPDGETRGQFEIKAGEHLDLSPSLPAAPSSSASPPLPLASASAPPLVATPPRSSWPTGALVAGGVGATGVAVGLVAGGVAIAYRLRLDEVCRDRQCPPASPTLAHARTAATVSSVGWAVGAAGLLTASVWWWLGRPAPGVALGVGPQHATIVWQHPW